MTTAPQLERKLPIPNVPVTNLLAAPALGVYLLVVLGATTSLLDGAVACPTWPACNGQWIVSLSDPALAAAWGHRFVTLVVGLLLLGTMVVAWIRPVESRVRLALGVAGYCIRDKSSSVHSPRSPGRRRYCRLLTRRGDGNLLWATRRAPLATRE